MFDFVYLFLFYFFLSPKTDPQKTVVIFRMQKKFAGLEEIFRLYVFTRSLPALCDTLRETISTFNSENISADIDEEALRGEGSTTPASSASSSPSKTTSLEERYFNPLNSLVSKFTLFQQLVEHVVDMDQLPDLQVRPLHDSDLLELHEERKELGVKAEKLLQRARNNWASFTDVKLENNNVHGLVFRTAHGDDERQLRANNSDVRILSILKV